MEGSGPRDDLVARLLEHCSYLSVTGDESELAGAVEDRYVALGRPVHRVGDSVVVGARGARPLVLLVGHLDVVPPTDEDLEPRRASLDGVDVVVGRGASDMKSGNVVAMSLLEDEELRETSAYELGLVLYAGEEGPAEENELADVLGEVSWLAETSLAVICEPTDGEAQLGCLGGVHALLTFEGRQAHSARPWNGENALTKAGAFLEELHQKPSREVEVDGVAFRDVWSATQAWTDNARNVIPGRFVVNLNYRFAPDRNLDDAEEELTELVAGRATVQIVDRAPPAPPRRSDPLVERFLRAVGAPVAGKQAWTDVARFAELGVPAINYGPGITSQAHAAGEYVRVDDVVDVHRRLRRFLAGG